MKKIVLTFILVISIGVMASAQEYKTGVGLRAGLSNGLTVKHFVNSKAAIEGLLAMNVTDLNGFEITGLYEIHNQAFEVEHLNWYYGGGAHIGSYDGGDVYGTVFGIDGILGIEYSFGEAPINIGLDWKPVLNLFGNTELWPGGGAISIRYIF